jgi:hypothetical protein
MTTSRRALLGSAAAAAIALFSYGGWAYMRWNSDYRDDLTRLLGNAGAPLVADAAIAVWQPDLNHKPESYFARRTIDEAGFRKIVVDAGLAARPTPDVVEAVWELPPGVALDGWTPSTVPPGAGLQASGIVGDVAVWVRWYRDQAYVVAQRAS